MEGNIYLILISGILKEKRMNTSFGGAEIKNIYERLIYIFIPNDHF